MIFLIEYNRNAGQTVSICEFDDTRLHEAEDLRLEMELDLNRKGIDHEVVLLQAVSEEALRRTHLRYFASLTEMLEAAIRHEPTTV